jgi:hypothetical protein
VCLHTRDESLVPLRTRLSMFEDVARARLSLMLPGWLLHLCLMRSMCACAQWLICRALAYKASSSNTHCSSLPIVIVVVAFARCDMKMPCTRIRGLVVQHSSIVVADCFCFRRRCATRYENAVRLRTRPCHHHSSLSLP